jgi:hypothetical protein
MTENTERVRNVLVKLVRLRESSNPHEAALAAQRISELTEKYDVTLADIREDKASVGEDRGASGTNTWLAWYSCLTQGIRAYCHVGSYRAHGTAAFVGFERDRVMAAYLFEHLVRSVRNASGPAMREARKRGEHIYSARVWGNSFRHGMAREIRDRLVAMAEADNAPCATGNALVVVKSAEIDAHMATLGLRTPSAGRRALDRGGAAAGHAAGKRVNINRPVRHAVRQALA